MTHQDLLTNSLVRITWLPLMFFVAGDVPVKQKGILIFARTSVKITIHYN